MEFVDTYIYLLFQLWDGVSLPAGHVAGPGRRAVEREDLHRAPGTLHHVHLPLAHYNVWKL